jgi:5-methyltetrahydrofolate--homocysteine methyltransferase
MRGITVLDGGMGTELQRRGLEPGGRPELFALEHPEIIEDIHRGFIEAGSEVIYSCTFGANSHKLKGTGREPADVIRNNVGIALDAAKKYGSGVRTALDLGPIGELLEPMGTLTFEEAYDIYKEEVTAGAAAGADIIVIETLTDLYEAKAALLAAKENSDLPVWVTMTFEKNGRTFLGTTVPAMAVTLGSLGADAIGINCSLGPKDIKPLVEELMEWTDVPVIVKPNAGLPDPRTGEYAMDAEEFGEEMRDMLTLGISAAGGCCGTDPGFTRSLCRVIDEAAGQGVLEKAAEERRGRTVRSGVCSYGGVAEYGRLNVIGERINPTGKKRLQQALRDGDLDYVKQLAVEQQEAGADILDINVGAQGIDEVEMVKKVVKAVQSVTDLPVQIDSADAAVIEAGVRVCNGRPIINSVNGERQRMDSVFPVAAKYGTALIGLAMGGGSLPETSEDRLAIIDSILAESEKYGIRREDMLIDCLTMTISAQQSQAVETLKTIKKVHDDYGLHCAIGASNISFGLPMKVHVTEAYLLESIALGVDFAIVNPNLKIIGDALAAAKALSGQDDSCAEYIERFRDEEAARKAALKSGKKEAPAQADGAAAAGAGDVDDSGRNRLEQAVIKGLSSDAAEITKELLGTMDGMDIINTMIIPALDTVGDRYEKEIIFLPQLINAANAACAGLDLIKDSLAKKGSSVSRGTIVLATVKGDIHDIGKNIVKVVLENYGYRIIDLGRDVAPERIVETVKQEDVRLVGLSALMTTTVPSMEETIRQLRKAGCDCKVMVGGAVLTQDYADDIGADYYSKDAQVSVQIAKEVLG